ncbi:CopD family protein [Erwinia amylovora]|uniref:CopD family protein n=1 Tax=Erwinia amylovora TaxID=552 RepID=UPI001F04743A|nr:CopD family protein [Erwinia amylovora]
MQISGALNALLIPGWPVASFKLLQPGLAVKISLVAVMVAIELYNRYGLVPCFQRSGACAQQPFITTRLVAIILAAAVLLTVSWFVTPEPAQAISRAG